MGDDGYFRGLRSEEREGSQQDRGKSAHYFALRTMIVLLAREDAFLE